MLQILQISVEYEGYGICFDEGGTFSKGGINNGRNVLIFGVHENSLVHANNKSNNIYVMGDLFVQGINDTTLYAEKIYSQNFTAVNKKFVLSLHFNGDDPYFICYTSTNIGDIYIMCIDI